MGFLGADSFLGMVMAYRMVHIEGRFGGGKTALAVKIAERLLETGKVRYCISNIPIVWRDDPAKVELREGKRADCVVVLDEAGLFLETGREAKKFMAYLRKMNIVLVMPSVLEPAGVARMFSVQRTMTWTPLGIPLWWYNARLRYGRQKDSYSFGWWRPWEIFGIYDTEGAPDDDGGLYDYVKDWTKELQAASKSKVSFKRYADSEGLAASNALGAFSGAFASQQSGLPERSVQSQLSAVESGGGDAAYFDEAAYKLEKAISILDDNRYKRKT